MLALSDAGAAISTVILLILFYTGKSEIWHLYATSALAGALLVVLDTQDQVEDSTEGDEDTACGGNFPGNVFVHIFYLYIQPGNKPPCLCHVISVFIPELLEHYFFFFPDAHQGAGDDNNQVRKTGDPVVQHQH